MGNLTSGNTPLIIPVGYWTSGRLVILSHTGNRNIWIGAALFGLALVLRFAYLTDLAALPFFDNPIMDASYHDSWARRIAGGDLLGNEPFFRAPLYAYLLGAIYRLSEGSYLLPRLLQFILGGLTCVMTYVLTQRALGRLAAIAAGVICAVYPVLIYFDGELLTEPLFTFLSVLGVLLLDTARRRKRLKYWFLGGLALGLALITRPTIGLFLPAAVAGALAFSGRRWVAAALVLVGIAAPTVPVTAHNYAVSGEFIPVVWQGGLNLYLGNNPAADGWSATSPEIRKDWWGGFKDQIAIARAEMGRDPSYGEVSAYWQGRALQFMKTEPGRFSKLLLRKIALFWGSREFPNNQDYNFYRLHSWVLKNPLAGFGVVAPLALVGLFALGGAWKKLYYPYAYVITYFLVTIGFFVCSRYRAPVVPLLALFAGGALSWIVDSLRKRKTVRSAAALIGLAVAALVVNLNPAGIRLPDLAQSFTQMGKVYMERGDETAAEAQFRKALDVNPAWAEAYEQLGLLEMKQGAKDEAEAYLRKAIDVSPEQAGAHRALAMLYLSDGDLEKARRSVMEAIEIAPYLEDSHNILGSIEREAGKPEAALRAFEKELEINPTNWRTHANLGSLFESTGELDKAEASYLRAIELQPGNPNLVLALAGIYTSQGRKEEARRLLKQASPQSVEEIDLRYNQAAMLQEDGDLGEAREIYERILEEMPGHERTLVNLGVIYARQGDDQRALKLWRRALEVNPDNRTARRNIELLTGPDPGSD